MVEAVRGVRGVGAPSLLTQVVAKIRDHLGTDLIWVLLK